MIRLGVFAIASLFLATSAESIRENSSAQPPIKGSRRLGNATRSLCYKEKIPLTKCCRHGELYRTGLSYCRHGVIDSEALLLPVFSAASNEILPAMCDFPEDFELAFNSISCPDGFVGKTTDDFTFFNDGTMRTKHLVFLPHEFCISEIIEEHVTRLIARFCIPDPCKGIHCARKCCPLGTAINKTSRMCQPSPTAASLLKNVTFRDTSGIHSVKLDAYTLMDGVTPQCSYNNGRQSFSPSEFYLLPDGRMKVPSFPCHFERATKEYCIDHFIHDNDKIEVLGIRCFTSVYYLTEDLLRSLQIQPYFLLISSFFLMTTTAIYVIIPEIRDSPHGLAMMSYFVSMAVFYTGLALIKLGVGLNEQNETNALCKPLAVITHYFFLATFSWLNVICFDLWWTFKWLRPPTSVSEQLSPAMGLTFALYSIYAWGLPFGIVLTGQILEAISHESDILGNIEIIKPQFGFVKCWFMCREAFLVYLYIPLTGLILSNIVFFIMTALLFHRTSNEAAFATGTRNIKQKFCIIFNLFILMGVSWMWEIISFALEGSFYRWIVTDMINALMGVIIFVIFVCKPRIWKLLKQRLLPYLDGRRNSLVNRSVFNGTSNGSLMILRRLTIINSSSGKLSTVMNSFRMRQTKNDNQTSSSSHESNYVNMRQQQTSSV